MQELTKSQRARIAISELKTLIDALTIRGFYRPSGKFGKTIEGCLRELSPEIYGSMNDSKIVELNGLEYVIDRLPKGIEQCKRIILTEEDQFDSTCFEAIQPLRRRRISYKISQNEICFIISRGISEIYDIITHITFLNIEAKKIHKRILDDSGNTRIEWDMLEKTVLSNGKLSGKGLDSAIWNLSIIIGRSYHETRKAFESLEKSKKERKSNNGLFSLIYNLGKRVDNETKSREDALIIYFTPSLMSIIGHQKYGKIWADNIKTKLIESGLYNRPLHIISSNPHSVVNTIYAYDALKYDVLQNGQNTEKNLKLYDFFASIKNKRKQIINFAKKHGLILLPDSSGSNIDCQIIDTSGLKHLNFHPEIQFAIPGDSKKTAEKTLETTQQERKKKIFNKNNRTNKNKQPDTESQIYPAPVPHVDCSPVIIVMDYAFGTQAFELMERLLKALSGDDGSAENKNRSKEKQEEGNNILFDIKSISIMGKAGILTGAKGDIMLSSAYVCEGTSDNYIVENDLKSNDFDDDVNVFTGPMATVLGTSLQNRDVLEMFKADWNAIGLEMEGGYYQKAINAAVIKGYLTKDVKMRYAYYASDNPMSIGNTLAAGPMGEEGIKPTYMITKIILQKILQ